MGRSTVHYADNETNNILKRLHNKLRPAGTPVERVEYIIELLLLRIFEAKIKQDDTFVPLRKLFEGENYRLLFSHLLSLNGEQILSELNKNLFPFYATIISKAREVVSGNLPQKMQDQLVLMEEVFANSNFTNNVKGGVIAEVIGLVNEIDEKWILKTDLLGDAIESALSETGGTKDLGLFRTPDHIRKMMVEMVDPNFTDTIFDPACGTAGFLFNAYEYVIEKAKRTRKFPAENVASQFYRTGIGGIEYQGRIRKMAAVNMYIRGLNPQNIEQGDSLKMFDPTHDTNSKSVVISNPPFGAERDQPAYPNVWEEYSKESETTILFVKLMFDLLKQSGRCAVVVSEGFLSWGQNSASALRKLLINEANLRAIISLPQGVFVSKGGQGAKTSILYFEKGQPTDFVWYYKIENDGFSMGANRKEIAGSQIPELLENFKEIIQGNKPKDTKHSFCVSKEQIETLDPRVSEKIRQEVKKKTEEKNAKKRKALLADLDEKLAKGKISKELYVEKLRQFDNVVEGQIDNEIAKAIEKAHSYNFNLQNYRSSLSYEQINAWNETLKDVIAKNGSTIEKKYLELKTTNIKTAIAIIASFDPRNAMQVDIVREYLNKLESGGLDKNEKLKKLEEILRKGYRYPMVKLGDIVEISGEEKVEGRNMQVLSITMNHGLVDQSDKFYKRIASSDISNYKVVKNGELVVGFPIDEGVLGFQQKYDEAAVSPAYDVWRVKDGVNVDINYLQHTLRSNTARVIYKSKMIGAAGRRRSIPKDVFLNIRIPIPPIEIQNELVEKIKKLKEIVEGAEKIEEGFTADQFVEEQYPEEFMEKLARVDGSPVKNLSEILDEIYVGGENIESGTGRLVNLQTVREAGIIGPSFLFKKNHVVYSKVRPNLQKCFFADFNGACSSDIYPLKVNQDLILPRYLAIVLQSRLFAKKTESFQDGRSGMPKINRDQLAQIKIPLPPLENQLKIVEKIAREIQALEGVRLLKHEARKRIEEILTEVWGDNDYS